MGYTKTQLLAYLKELQIDFATYEHPVVLTVEAQAKYVGHLRGSLSKNLLLKDKKHRYYVISALAGTNVDLKVMSQRLGLGKGALRMAPEEALQEILQVPLGCVTPFALINESASASNLDKFLMSIGRNPSYVDFEAETVVGKDNPPDLAAFVPVDGPQPSEQTNKAAVNVREQKQAPLEKKLTNISKDSKAEGREPLESAVLDGVNKRISSDLENLAMILKNAAYTQGFQAGIQSRSPRR
ncbi:hypothetical protein KFK09_020636 [Dendrobium nobile]|uniref:YbaK/aminoacyl-tRNA synthetase-associated domain-containing protein n=1 Tax=Dendrobium nobile TaxID=94219 RepID=A0A8T3ANQ7_DENNO|nr:hypothetical protein KFK09_020636 [Dendrobium nobile]